MLLSDYDIEQAIVAGDVTISPFQRDYLKPASVDIRLGTQMRFFIPKHEHLDYYELDPVDPKDENIVTVEIPMYESVCIEPRAFLLAHSLETITLGNTLGAVLMGKSTLGRYGLQVHATAGYIDPGFSGQLTLELVNLNRHRILLRPGMPIAQLGFHKLSSPVRYPYNQRVDSSYNGQTGATPPRPMTILNEDGTVRISRETMQRDREIERGRGVMPVTPGFPRSDLP